MGTGNVFSVSVDFSVDRVIKASSVKAIVGTIHATEGQLVAVKDIIMHPQYKCEFYQDDIAILELHHAVAKIGSLPLNYVVPAENTSVIVMGWGWNREDVFEGQKSETLKKAFVNVISNERCQAWYTENNKKIIIKEGQMCAGHEGGGIDACWADSGGPMVDERGTLIGVVSTGVGCGRPKLPGIYTRISKYTTWINSVISPTHEP